MDPSNYFFKLKIKIKYLLYVEIIATSRIEYSNGKGISVWKMLE
jgi:hypothetical protein